MTRKHYWKRLTSLYLDFAHRFMQIPNIMKAAGGQLQE